MYEPRRCKKEKLQVPPTEGTLHGVLHHVRAEVAVDLRTPGGVLYCWGQFAGSVRPAPQPYANGLRFKSVALNRSICGLTVEGKPYCLDGGYDPVPIPVEW